MNKSFRRASLSFAAGLCAALILAPGAFAAIGGPDARGYTYADSSEERGPAYAFEDISGTGLSVYLEDDETTFPPLELGFTFRYYGASYTEVYVCSNGFLTFFGGQNSPYIPAALPAPGQPSALIAPLWTDLNPFAGGYIHYETRGAAPYRRFIVQFTDVPHYSGSPAVTFQVKLFETNDHIEFHYAAAGSNGQNRSIGITNQDHSTGLNYQFSADSLPPNHAIRFRPPGYTDSNDPLGPAYDFEDISAVATSIGMNELQRIDIYPGCWNTWDEPCVDFQVTPYVPVGFEFSYFGVPTRHVRGASLGLLLMADARSDYWVSFWDPAAEEVGSLQFCGLYPYSNESCDALGIPSAVADAYVAGFWYRNSTLGEGSPGFLFGQPLRYATLGEAPNRRFILEMTSNSFGAYSTHQYKLFERDGTIEVHYQSAQNWPVSEGSPVVVMGLENHNGSTGIQYRASAAPPTVPLAVRYAPFGSAFGQEGNQTAAGSTAVESVEVISESEIDVVFNGPVQTPLESAVYVSGPGAGTLLVNPLTVTPLSSSAYRLTWFTSSSYRMRDGQDVTVRFDTQVVDAQDMPLAAPAAGVHAGGGLALPSIPTLSSPAFPATTDMLIPITVTFNYAVSGFEASDVELVNAALYSFASTCTTPWSDPPCTVYEIVVVPLGPGELTVSVPSEAATDRAGNLSGPSNVLTIDFTGLLPSSPNDDFAHAAVLTGDAGAASAWNIVATTEPGEPHHAGAGDGRSVWWQWQAPVSGSVWWNIDESSFPAVIAVYQGSAVDALTPVGSPLSTGPHQFQLNAFAGETYYIAVDGSGGQAGEIALSWTMYLSTVDPANYVFVNDDANDPGYPDLHELLGFPGIEGGTNALMTSQMNQPISVWTSSDCTLDWIPAIELIYQEGSEPLLIGVYESLAGSPEIADYSTEGGYQHLFTGPSDVGQNAHWTIGGGIYVHRPSTGETFYSNPAHNADGKVRMIQYASDESIPCIDYGSSGIQNAGRPFVAVSLASDPEDSSFTDVVLRVVNQGSFSSRQEYGLIVLANAGPDIHGKFVGDTVVLSGGALNVGSWHPGSRPVGSVAQLVSVDWSTAYFVPDRVGVYTFIFEDSVGPCCEPASDSMQVFVGNRPPTAVASGPSEAPVGTPVQVDGSSSFDPDNQPIQFLWSFVETPAGSTANLQQPFYARPVFVPDMPGTYTISVTVQDDLLASSSQTVQVTAVADPDPVTVVSIVPSTTGPTSATSVSFAVEFSEAVVNFDHASDLVIQHSGTAHSGISVSGSGASYTVTVTGISGTGSFTLAVNTSSGVQSVGGVPLSFSPISDPVVIDSSAGSSSIVYVEIGYTGTALGTQSHPAATLGHAVILVEAGGQVRFVNSGTLDETPRITKAMRLIAQNGPVRIGVSGAKKAAASVPSSGDGDEADEADWDLLALLGPLFRNMAGTAAGGDGESASAESDNEADTASLTVFEPVVPSGVGDDGVRLARPDALLAVRLRAPEAIDPRTLFSPATIEYAGRGIATWMPVDGDDTRDIWVLLEPADGWYVDELVRLEAEARTASGERVVSEPAQFRISGESEPGEPVAQPQSGTDGHREASGVPVDVTINGETYTIGPGRVFDTPQRVWLPVPDGIDPSRARVEYYLHGGAQPGWYPADRVDGWFVPDSYAVLDVEGQPYIGFIVRHAATVRVVQSE